MPARPLALLVAAALVAAATAGCASPARGAATAPRLVPAQPVPRLEDLVRGRSLFFTRRLGDEVVAFSFTPDEITSRGRLVGTLGYDGRTGSGAVTGVAGTLGFAGGDGGGCGRITVDFAEVPLEALGVRARFDVVSVDLARAGRPGRAAATLCEGARDLVARLKGLETELKDLLPRD